MTHPFDTGLDRFETMVPSAVEAVVLRLTVCGLLTLGGTAAVVGLSVLIGHVVTKAAGALAVSALLPFLG